MLDREGPRTCTATARERRIAQALHAGAGAEVAADGTGDGALHIGRGAVAGRDGFMATKTERREAGQGRTALVSLTSPAVVLQGYDSVNGDARQTALKGETASTGANVIMYHRICTDLESLSQALQINQSLSVGMASVGSADEKMEFIHNLTVTTYSVSIVVYVSKIISTETVTNAWIKDDVAPPTDDAALNEFFQIYGDSYVSALTRGGEYYAVYTFHSQTQDEQTNVKATINAHGVVGGTSISTDLQIQLDDIRKSTQVYVEVQQGVRGVANLELPKDEEIVEFARTFPTRDLAAPVITSFQSAGYETIKGIGTHFSKVKNNRLKFVGTKVKPGLSAKLAYVLMLKNQIDLLHQIYDFYGGHSDTTLDRVANEVDADLDAINNTMNDYSNDPTAELKHPALKSLSHKKIPMLNYSTFYTPYYGSPDQGVGFPFDDVDNIGSYLQLRTHITSIQFWATDQVFKFVTRYADTSKESEKVHGGDFGTPSNVLSLQTGQYVQQITGTSAVNSTGNVSITSLGIMATNSDGSNPSTVQGGIPAGGTFASSRPADTFVLGFRGRNRNELHSLGLVCAKFLDATWQKAPWKI